MTIQVSTVKPGLLVSLKTTIKGGVNYARIDIEAAHRNDEGAEVAEWQTRKEVPNPEEYAAAVTARGKARSLIVGACCLSSFGYLCPEEKAQDLAEALQKAQQIARDFNAQSALCKIGVYALVGRIAASDAEAQRAINAEIKELIETMQSGVADADAKRIREAANKARQLESMLSADAAISVSEAIKEARTAARAIVKRIEKSGETASEVIKEISLEKMKAARFAFLDLEDGEEVEQTQIAARSVEYDAADIAPDQSAISAAPSLPQLEI